MESASYAGLMAVFAVSSSVALVAVHVQKRLTSDFFEKIQLEIINGDSKKKMVKKKVRFAADVVEPSSDNKEYRRRRLGSLRSGV